MPACARRFIRPHSFRATSTIFPARPDFPARTDSRLNPKISGVYILPPNMRVCTLRTERVSGRPAVPIWLSRIIPPEAGTDRELRSSASNERFLTDQLSLDATLFHNGYRDLIVSLGGSLSTLSQYYTDNVAKRTPKAWRRARIPAREHGFRSPAITCGWRTEVLSLNGGSGLVQQYYYLGQPLMRQPKQSGSAVVNFHHGKLDANLTGYFRGHDLDVEPNFGAFGGLFWSGGYVNAGHQRELPVARESHGLCQPA